MSAKTKKRTLVAALSGGVDSAVAAHLMLEEGFNVVGAHLRLIAKTDLDQARENGKGESIPEQVARQLGVDLTIIDHSATFKERVLRYSWNEYRSGRTPNPCVVCNPLIKFDRLLQFADEIGAEGVVTGHYCRVRRQGDETTLHRGFDKDKNQTYFLCRLTRDQLRRFHAPLGERTKEWTRTVARELGLLNADRPESQDACFVMNDATLASTLADLFGDDAPRGTIIDSSGNELRRHEGVHQFTIGQRKKLGVALGKPAYVTRIDGSTGEVVVSVDESDLMASELTALDVNWQVDTPEEFTCLAQIRYNQRARPARVTKEPNNSARVVFEEPVKSIAPGQAVAFHQGDQLLGGGWIS